MIYIGTRQGHHHCNNDYCRDFKFVLCCSSSHDCHGTFLNNERSAENCRNYSSAGKYSCNSFLSAQFHAIIVFIGKIRKHAAEKTEIEAHARCCWNMEDGCLGERT